MEAKLTGFVIYVEAIIYLLLHNLQVFTFSDDSTKYRFLHFKMIQECKLVSKFLLKKFYKFQKISFAKVSSFNVSRFLALFVFSL